MNAAIVALTKGYSSVEGYAKLLNRNAHIFQHFNSKLNNQYPLIFFHEGNITPVDQRYIRDSGKNTDVRFVDVSDTFHWPANIPWGSVEESEHFNPGYRLMCAFNSRDIWNYCRQFDYIFRIDEDVLIGELNYNPFEYMEEHQLVFLASRFCQESHVLTNENLPIKSHELLGDKWQVEDYDQYNPWIPYTNLYIARTSLFLREDVQAYLNGLLSDARFYTQRWGDAPILGIVLRAFAPAGKVSPIMDMIHLHGSHDTVTMNGRVLRGLLSDREAELYDCVPTGQGQWHHIAREHATPEMIKNAS